MIIIFFFFSSRRRHTRSDRDWSSDVCSSDLLSFERYMGATSSVTLGLFYKKLSNTLDYENFTRTFTNGGATETAQIQGPVNRKDGGKVKGVELAYQTFFDFLPGLWNGLGMQANYTYVGESGVHNTNLIDATSGGGVG